MSHEIYVQACKEIAHRILAREIKSRNDILKIKSEVCREFKLTHIPSNPDIIRYSEEDKEKLREMLKLKPVRSTSGIVILSVMTEPFPCPHGRCAYCPRFPGAPVSYTGREPAAMRAIENEFDPYRQIRSRLKQLEDMGHSTQKIELIIQGGTFNATPAWYRKEFMRRVMKGILNAKFKDYKEAILAAERSKHRIVGMTIETRPDQTSERQIDWMLEMGFTRVELGVQTIFNEVYSKVKRGHDVKAVIDATRRLKDAGFKVCYHIMPGLPDTTQRMDLDIFRSLFENENFRPDMLKIYPTLVLEGTELYEWWKNGLYRPYSTNEAADLIELIKANFIPKWSRIMRVQRDIPAQEIIDGVKKGNLRQIIAERLKSHGLKCRCIRCREIGHKRLKNQINKPPDVVFTISAYPASRGMEYFIAAEDLNNDALIGFLRLRKPSEKAWRPEITSMESFLIRELHVYGEALPLGCRSKNSWQHRGVGTTLLKRAEELALEKGGEKIVVISGIGAKEYYFKHGYVRDGPYVSKMIK
ncbi:tRNA uridine(34) 5-carboxymethylaminomethyl modification radical SAM/GNAT enzyme Elp3 [Candidatus Geothermarchaeota archaeon]|nr:MAG: tRNA uridine(34) 5-carboxymethylaminomethyl modification radical SAM/GNAT enzyme Elp3 [Candidatus Geothermarchaeota archaeon]